MRFPTLFDFAIALVGCQALASFGAAPGPVRSWLTTEDLRFRLTPQAEIAWQPGTPDAGPDVVRILPDRTHQAMFGMGASLEPTTCSNLARLPDAERRRAIDLLVHPSRGIGMNLMRVCIGTPDFTGDPWYSYCDVPPGETDPDLRRFSIDKDRGYILPVLREAAKANPDLRFFASPWSPPGWMKSNGTMIGGHLLPRWYDAYARYFVRFVQAYAAEGVPIHAVTVQNEPGVDRAKEKDPKWHYPSCHWTGEQERDFIRDHLGPAFRAAGLETRIWCYDHNYNLEPKGDDAGIGHPRTILSDPKAAAFVDGVAFHGYVGDPSGMTRFHGEFPAVPIHFTEGSVFSIWGPYDLIQRFRNRASSYNAWVCLLDDKGRPNNGPFPATHAILKLHSDTLRIEELLEYYAYGHFMKFVRVGAHRIESPAGTKDFDHVAFRNPDGTVVVVGVNTTTEPIPVRWALDDRIAVSEVPAKSVRTWAFDLPAPNPVPRQSR